MQTECESRSAIDYISATRKAASVVEAFRGHRHRLQIR